MRPTRCRLGNRACVTTPRPDMRHPLGGSALKSAIRHGLVAPGTLRPQQDLLTRRESSVGGEPVSLLVDPLPRLDLQPSELLLVRVDRTSPGQARRSPDLATTTAPALSPSTVFAHARVRSAGAGVRITHW